MQILLDGLAHQPFEAMLALGKIHVRVLLETGVASSDSWLLFVLFEAAAGDGGDGREMVREVVVALLQDYRLSLGV